MNWLKDCCRALRDSDSARESLVAVVSPHADFFTTRNSQQDRNPQSKGGMRQIYARDQYRRLLCIARHVSRHYGFRSAGFKHGVAETTPV